MLTPEQVQAYLDDNGYPAHLVEQGLPGLLRRYAAFVDEVEQGYPHRLSDYRHDLDIRAILSLAGYHQEPSIQALDERLRAMLTPSSGRLWESACDDPWWDFGLPRNPGSLLRRGLAAEGLLPDGA